MTIFVKRSKKKGKDLAIEMSDLEPKIPLLQGIQIARRLGGGNFGEGTALNGLNL